MARVQTVGGPVDSSALGVTLIHEHLNFRTFPCNCPPHLLAENMDYQAKLLKDAVAVGVQTIVDLGPFPDIEQIVELRQRVPELNIVLSTGAYVEGRTPEWIRRMDEERLAEHMRHNIVAGYEGFEHTGIRAGIIKVGAEISALTDWEKKVFRAAARVHRELRIPIATHACSGCREQMLYLKAQGAHIPATFYSHIEAEFGWEGRTREQEADYLTEVVAAGGYLLFNNFDFEFDTPFPDMLYLINEIERRGYGDRILYSIDTNWSYDENGRRWHEGEREHPETGRRTYAYAITDATPMLMKAGVSLQRIWKYLVENPRRYFEAMDSL